MPSFSVICPASSFSGGEACSGCLRSHVRPAGCWGFLGRASVPYVTRINRTTHQAAAARGLPVAEVSAHFLPPWPGKFAPDRFHPSQDGYRDWARALLATVPPLAAAA